MVGPADLQDKLQDSRVIALDLMHDLTGNPVDAAEERSLRTVSEIQVLLASALHKTTILIENWPGGP